MSTKKIRIAVADDHQICRDGLISMLDPEQYEVVGEANNGITIVDLAKQVMPDIILMDIQMPKMDGIELLDKLSELEKEVQIIMISAHGNIETAVEAVKKGAYDFLSKPIDLNRLLVTVRNAIEKKDLVTETKTLKKKINKSFDIIGESKPIKNI
jgi:DNA-binding NtrC family response regulator